MASRTLPTRVEVDDLTDLIQLVARDCGPLQEIRELTQNGFEAIERARQTEPGFQADIVWDVDWAMFDSEGIYRLSIADNGDGMTPEDIKKYINRVSSSAQRKSRFRNFGIGGKVTAGVNNPAGVVYRTWSGGNGTMATYWLDPDVNRYGLKQQELGDGSFAHTIPIAPGTTNGLKPSFINNHGTVVTLCGKDPDHHTMQAPQGTPYPTHWLSRYLNRRYFRFPENVRVRAREFRTSDPAGWPTQKPSGMPQGGQLRTVRGQKHHLDRVTSEQDRGKVDLKNCAVYWWVLPDDHKVFEQNDIWQSTGHTAALYRDELFELKDTRAGRSMLTRFGILFGHKRVVIYVEPKVVTGQTVESNTARSALLINNEPIPWDSWGSEFRENMPSRLQVLMNEYLNRSTENNHAASIRERLKDVLKLFRLSRYRRATGASDQADVFNQGGGHGNGSGPTTYGPGTGTSRAGAGDTLAAALAAHGELVQQVLVQTVQPDVIWVNLVDKTREPDELDDRAASYDPKSNKIKANADFRVFADMIAVFERQFPDVAAVKAIIHDAVREWFEQQLIEAVLGTEALRGAKRWNDDDMKRILSDEALTMAVMPRYHVHMAIKRTLGHRIKALKQSPQADPAVALATP